MTRRMPMAGAPDLVLLLAVWCLAAWPAAGLAQIKTDGSLGPARTLSGPAFAIPSNLGTTVGSNLFHSFSTFNLLRGESATFSGASGIRNVLARVTGGATSNIDGLLACSISGANLFLINPAGVLFGPNARLDVSGSFCATTADRIHLGTDGLFAATNPSSSLLTVAAPSAFGFVSGSAAAITVDRSTLQGKSGASLSLVGGDIQLTDAHLSTLSGDVVIQSAGGAGRIAVDRSAQGAADMPFWGAITLTGNIFSGSGWNLWARGAAQANIFVRGGTITSSGASILAGGSTDARANGDITLEAQHELLLQDMSMLQTLTHNATNAGNISLVAPRVSVLSDSRIYSTTQSLGASGDIDIRAATGLTCTDSRINTDTWSAGTAGNIRLRSDVVLRFDGGSFISSDAISSFLGDSLGASGTITLAAPRVEFAGAAKASATSYSNAQRSGSIRIDAETLVMTEQSALVTDIHSENPTSTAGTIDIRATTIDMTDSAISSTPSYGSGQGGNISIAAQYLLMKNSWIYVFSPSGLGGSGSITVDAGTIEMFHSGLLAFTFGSKAGGDITVTAGRLSLDDNAAIMNSTYSSAPAGNILIRAGAIALDNNSFFTASTEQMGRGGRLDIAGNALRLSKGSFLQTATNGTGNAGSILIDVGTLQILDGAGLNASTNGAGAGGDIAITAGSATIASGTIFSDALADSSGQAGAITVRSGSLAMDNGRIRARALGLGHGGSIAITTGTGLLRNGSLITTQSRGAGDAGEVAIRSTGGFTLSNSQVTTEAASADGGNIVYDVGGRLDLRNGAIVTSVHGGTGDGGNITIRSGYLLSNSGIIRADADLGHGGNIDIWTRAYVPTPYSIVSASSRAGLDGQIMLAANLVDVAGNLVVLPGALLDVDRLIPQSCEYRDPRVAGSSFLLQGRRGVPPAPGSLPR